MAEELFWRFAASIFGPNAFCKLTSRRFPQRRLHHPRSNRPFAWTPARIFERALACVAFFVAGGHVTNWVGLPNAYRYNPFTNNWTRLPDMNNGRWYPTSTMLPSGDILMVSGWVNTSIGVNVEPQVWQTATGSWRNLTSAHLALPFYPFMHVAPNGKVFC